MEIYNFIIKEQDLKKRLDQFLSEVIPDLSRTYIKKLIEDDNVTVNLDKSKVSYKLQEGDEVQIGVPTPEKINVEPQDINLDIVYEDEHLVVVNKVQGMVVHPAPGNYSDTLVNALLFHIKDLSDINGVYRPGIVHRIDKDTSGLLVVAKSDLAHKSLSIQLKDHTINRKYIALVEGTIVEENGTIDAPIGRHQNNRKKMTVTDKNSKNAITHFKVIRRFNKNTLIEAKLKTGRTHQIRVHMSFIGHPVVGDNTYGLIKQKLYSKGQLLHAYLLGFDHPSTGEYMEFSSEVPKYFQAVLDELS
ncbi:RluA family pseudouridine synthase [Alkalibaculum sp. M08DMB]|uniref:Pseudouridine synthase n=1 Tax=Alkalibaculum sporogenes TaxID=2655001 RepID=A0A6A7KAF8_9FIRM|nr:RluA family pseudouridine synthase [Alkalibaculum sporogenes]MPW26023.1 RluA family pseudouridine synthase [Alkalibaculum sporogenes]